MAQCPRYLAIDILCQWQQSEQPIDALLEPQLQALTDVRDRKLMKAVVFGSLRTRGSLDWLLSRLSSTPLHRLKPNILQALRIGAYQLLFLDRVPPAAAINSTVEAIKKMGQPRWLTGFVNGVLRNVARGRKEFLEAMQAGKAPAEALFNHPEWLLSRWRSRYGEDGLEAICRSNNQAARLCLRVNTAKITVADYLTTLETSGIPCEPGQYLPEALWLDQAGAIADLPGYDQGWFFVQDEIAQLIGGLIVPFPEGNCLDGCAGVGGKTAILAGLVPRGGRVVAIEPQPGRQQLFRENMARLGLAEVDLYPGTLAEYAEGASDDFTAVLIDAPCSGLGVTGRHPDIRWQRQAGDLLKFQAQQLSILQGAAPLVAPGGVLVYATCSTEPEENEAVIDLFLGEYPQFVIENAIGSLPPPGHRLVDAQGFLRTLPGHHGSDGFFGARLKRMR